MKEPHKSKAQVNKKKKRYKTTSNLFQDSQHVDPASCDNLLVDFDKITGFRRTKEQKNKRTRNLRTDPSNKSQ